MCRLFAITSETHLSPMVALEALDVMREGHDGSGVGLLLSDLGGPFKKIKDSPILSGIFTKQGISRLDNYMTDLGFLTKHEASIRPSQKPPAGVPQRAIYLIRAYEYPDKWEGWSREKIYSELTRIRLELADMGAESQEMIVFSFWPDLVMIKEIGDPVTVGRYLKLDSSDLQAKVIMAQGRQNTNYDINLYACHPFFLSGFATMTNGENTAFLPIKEFLMSRGVPGYRGFESDSQVFVYILHYMYTHLGLGIEAYKHIITPLQDEDIEKHPTRVLLKHLKQTCRRLIIDGPNCVIGCLPDNTLFMAQDRKKLRPGVVGGRPGMYAFSSEICGLDAVIPDRDKSEDFQPMYTETAIVGPDRKEVVICKQSEPLPPLH
ncbi:MAG: glutamate synthase [Desulfococcus sp. 4484_241]|nr:MAG: glutamate synthase [Desulfococcus sp. 4484_241]